MESSVTVTDTTYNSGGTAAVNGWTITVPQNLLVQFPAAFKPWRDLSGFVGSEVSVSDVGYQQGSALIRLSIL
jgi:hypothetical protein